VDPRVVAPSVLPSTAATRARKRLPQRRRLDSDPWLRPCVAVQRRKGVLSRRTRRREDDRTRRIKVVLLIERYFFCGGVEMSVVKADDRGAVEKHLRHVARHLTLDASCGLLNNTTER